MPSMTEVQLTGIRQASTEGFSLFGTIAENETSPLSKAPPVPNDIREQEDGLLPQFSALLVCN